MYVALSWVLWLEKSGVDAVPTSLWGKRYSWLLALGLHMGAAAVKMSMKDSQKT